LIESTLILATVCVGGEGAKAESEADDNNGACQEVKERRIFQEENMAAVDM
jgi:hypothetical protein